MKLKKLTIYCLALFCASSSLYAQSGEEVQKKRSGNPIFPGWYADPEGVVLDGKFWIYPTYSAPYDEQTFMDAYSSPDLVHWTKHPRVLSKENIPWLRRALWAPAVIEANGRYYLFFGGNDIQNNSEIGGIGVAVADNPAGPFKDALGKPLIDKIVNGAQPIDQFVFRDDDGTYYMYYGGWGHCNIVKLSPDLLGVVPFDDGTGAVHAQAPREILLHVVGRRLGKPRLPCGLCHCRLSFRTVPSRGNNSSAGCRCSYRCRTSFGGAWKRQGRMVHHLPPSPVGRNGCKQPCHLH